MSGDFVPFKGLRPYESTDALYFYGRTDESRILAADFTVFNITSLVTLRPRPIRRPRQHIPNRIPHVPTIPDPNP